MGDADDNSDSEKDFDQNELEVALYSQIHFGSLNDSEPSEGNQNSYCQSATLPFRIGVKELPTRIITNVKKPIFGGDFIAFSSNNSDDGKSSHNHDSSSHQEKEKGKDIEPAVVEPSEDKPRTINKLENVSLKGKDRLKSDISVNNKTHHTCSPDAKLKCGKVGGLEVKTAVPDYMKNTDKICHDFSVANEVQNSANKGKTLECRTLSTKVNSKMPTLSDNVKLKEPLLPFSVTKSPVIPKVTQLENVSTDKTIKHTSSEPVKRQKVSNHIKSNLAKLESFLQLPKHEETTIIKCKKKSQISKTDAAVKPRKPAVFLRRPPAVAVKFHQDSDTNTDYTDSDASLSTSPAKRQQSNMKNSSLKTSLSQKDSSTTDFGTENIPDTGAKGLSTGTTVIKLPGPLKLSDVGVVSEKQESVTLSSIDENANSGSEDESDTAEMQDEESDTDQEEGDEDTDDVEDGSNQEVPASDSEDTDSSDPEDFLTETIPGLEFNLEKGADEFVARKSGSENWKIADRDRHNIIGTLNRYFVPKVIQCRNCKVDGHMSRDCPQPLKRRCVFCGTEGHSFQACPNAICFNCSAPGHRFTDCKEPKKNWNAMCGRCWMSGHDEQKCPDKWRQYHITVNSKGSHLQSAEKDVRNPLVFCYNCGKKGHLGFECRLPRMNKFSVAAYPFIARYDTKNNRKEMRQGSKVVAGGSRKAGCDKNNQCLSEDRKGRWHRTNESVRIENISGQHNRHEKEEHYHRGKKMRKSNLQKKKKNKADFKNDCSGKNEGNISIFRSCYAGHKRKFTDDDILDDFEGHQVKDNEWWGRNEKSAKRRKKNMQAYSPNTSNDWQSNKQKRKGWFPDEFSPTAPWSQTNRIETNHPQRYEEEWQINKQQQRFQEKHGHNKVYTPQFNRKQQTDNSYGSGENRQKKRKDGSFSSYMQQYAERPSSNKMSKQAHLNHSASWPTMQKAGSNFPPNRNGFQAHNDRFVAMKRNCDITVNIRK